MAQCMCLHNWYMLVIVPAADVLYIWQCHAALDGVMEYDDSSLMFKVQSLPCRYRSDWAAGTSGGETGRPAGDETTWSTPRGHRCSARVRLHPHHAKITPWPADPATLSSRFPAQVAAVDVVSSMSTTAFVGHNTAFAGPSHVRKVPMWCPNSGHCSKSRHSGLKQAVKRRRCDRHCAAAAEAPYEEEEKVKQEADGALTLSAKDQLTLSDYELPYIDEDDTEEEDQ